MKATIIFIIVLISIIAGAYFLFGNNKEAGNVPENKTPVKNMNAIIKTNLGEIELELFSEEAPNTVSNFVKLAKAGFYTSTKFHRVMKGFMIQGGDPLSADDIKKASWGTGGPGYKFDDEIGPNNHNLTGTIAMANAGPNTNGSQFFINVVDNNYLDTKHTVFGKVIRGIEIVHAIENTPVDTVSRPINPVIVQSIEIIEK
jgi:cyclophilin family peptidyl-prolyl cis-trans isomerase